MAEPKSLIIFARREGAGGGVTRDKHVFTEGFAFLRRDKGVTRRDKSQGRLICGNRTLKLFARDGLGRA